MRPRRRRPTAARRAIGSANSDGHGDGGARQGEQPLIRPDQAEHDGDDDRPEDRQEGAHAVDQQHGDRGERQEMIALRDR